VMADNKKQAGTLAALIGRTDLAPPPREPEPDLQPQAVAVPQAPQIRRYAEPDTEEWDDPDELENFDFDPAAPVVKPRKRRPVDYQTLRINAPTSKIMRQVWLANRRIDPALSYTEFATLVVQHGLRALKEERDRR
jgi:hypothetical protein